jgi:hypothetical protein
MFWCNVVEKVYQLYMKGKTLCLLLDVTNATFPTVKTFDEKETLQALK